MLFVSEKMAALNVVFKRLQRANLDHYCLELHSHRTNKREVVQQLYKTYLQRLKPGTGLSDQEIARLLQRREHLNAYVLSLHKVRQPLSRSVFTVLGELGKLERMVLVSAGNLDLDSLTPAKLDVIDQLTVRLGRVWTIACEGKDFRWYGLLTEQYSPMVKAVTEETLDAAHNALREVVKGVAELCRVCGLPEVETLRQCEWLQRTAELLYQGPGVERAWLEPDLPLRLLEQLQSLRQTSESYARLKATLEASYTMRVYALPPDQESQLVESCSALKQLVGQSLDFDAEFVASRREMISALKDLTERLCQWTADGNALQSSFGLQGPLTVANLSRLVRVVELCGSKERPDSSWFTSQTLSELQRHIAILKICVRNPQP